MLPSLSLILTSTWGLFNREVSVPISSFLAAMWSGVEPVESLLLGSDGVGIIGGGGGCEEVSNKGGSGGGGGEDELEDDDFEGDFDDDNFDNWSVDSENGKRTGINF